LNEDPLVTDTRLDKRPDETGSSNDVVSRDAKPLSQEEIESLLWSVRERNQFGNGAADFEELDPGEIQYLRSGSTHPTSELNNLSAAALISVVENAVSHAIAGTKTGESGTSSNRPIDQSDSSSNHNTSEHVDNGDKANERLFESGLAEIQMPRSNERSSDQSPLPDSHSSLTFEDLGDIELDVSIELGHTELLIDDILKLRDGSVIELDRLAGDPVDIVANGRLVGRGELIVVKGKFAVRLSEVI
jgi:flagellar motor switch protein FliN